MSIEIRDQAAIARQLQDDARLLAKYEGRTFRAFVKVRGKDAWRPNPLSERLREARKRLEDAKSAGVTIILRCKVERPTAALS
ncbi:MAG: hypothetical protein ACR65W_03955 [Methylocystis sp.]|uniref:hypothetical protein n=1 Tax=Methylocystis sp. TaxID=1911079 RepID=UPI003DA33E59